MYKTITVITGASSGIGKATTLLLAREPGHRVFAGILPGEEEALQDAPGNVTPLVMDVTEPEHIQRAVALVSESANGRINLINNAGIAVYGPLEHVPIAQLREQFEVNLFGALAVTQGFLPLMRRLGGGRIINVGSMNGRLAIPIVGPYCASKFGLRSISDTLRLELALHGIHVVLIEAGVVKTPLVQGATRALRGALTVGSAQEHYGATYAAMEEMSERFYRRASEPEDVARTIWRILAARKPKAYYRVGADAWAVVLMDAFVPVGIRDRITKWLYGF